MHEGQDLIVKTEDVIFVDTDDEQHLLEPDIVDLYFLAELIDAAVIVKNYP